VTKGFNGRKRGCNRKGIASVKRRYCVGIAFGSGPSGLGNRTVRSLTDPFSPRSNYSTGGPAGREVPPGLSVRAPSGEELGQELPGLLRADPVIDFGHMVALWMGKDPRALGDAA
jgi:hypothetical protein